jgi:hypothetical protein
MLLLFVLLFSCTTQGREPHAAAEPGQKGARRDELIDAYRSMGKLLFVYGTGDSSAASAYRKLLQSISHPRGRVTILVRSDREVTEAELQQSPLYLVGTPANNAVLQRLMPQLPFAMHDDHLQFNARSYAAQPTLSLGFYPNPLAPHLPLSLTTGLHEQDILSQLEAAFGQQYFWFSISSWGYQVRQQGVRQVMGFFDDSDPAQWKITGRQHWDFSTHGQESMARGQVQFHAHGTDLSAATHDSLGMELEGGWKRLAAACGWQLGAATAHVHTYASTELKGLETGDTRPANCDDKDGSIHLVVHPEHAGRETHVGNLWLIRQRLGKAASPQLELGLAVWPTVHWQRLGWQTWAQRFATNGHSLTIMELFDAETWAHESPYLKECMSAALVDFLLTTWGADALLASYMAPDLQRLLPMEKAFAKHLRNLPVTQSPSAVPHPLPAFQKAFNFAHEGYQIFNGYLSAEATRSLAYTADKLYCNATAIIPYAGMADVHAPNWIEFSDGAGAENDESIVHCIWSAQQLGQTVMLKPQVWPWREWTGEVAMGNEADWKLFFDRYLRWIRHYALMAELYGADILCVGVEFSKATLQRPDDWRQMVERLRGIYHGKITYAANWGEEFEQCKFWDALDYVSINCYYPLSKKDKPTQKELDAGFREVVAKVEKVAMASQKPVLFTEIGFRSCAAPWVNPHAEADGRAVDPAAQAACYQAMISGLAGKDWCKGIYLWKWPAYMEDGRHDRSGFTPLSKPAESLVADWFRRL